MGIRTFPRTLIFPPICVPASCTSHPMGCLSIRNLRHQAYVCRRPWRGPHTSCHSLSAWCARCVEVHSFSRVVVKVAWSVSSRAASVLGATWCQCLSGNASTYLVDDCQLIADISSMRRLRGTDRCFATARPCLWNSLPSKLRQCDSLREFKRLLKTRSGTTALCM